MAGFWGRRKREQEELAAQDADLARRAEQALVSADERIRTTSDELSFAEAELGESLTADLRTALAAVRTHLREAFQLHQLNHDEIPDTDEELRTRNVRILQLCDWAQDLLDEKTSVLAESVAKVRRSPEIIAQVRAEAAALSARIPQTNEAVSRLSARYADSAMHQITASAAEAEQLISFATHSADVSERRRAAKQNEEANVALETVMEATRRASALLDAVEDFEIEALRAESTLAEVVADSRGDLIAARTAPNVPAVAQAVAALQAALGALTPSGQPNDPFAELSQLRDANSALDQAIAQARHRAENPLPSIAQVQHAIDDADRQLGWCAASSPDTAAGSVPTPAPASPRRSAFASICPTSSPPRTLAKRRSSRRVASRTWPPKRCSSRSATSIPRVPRIRTGAAAAGAAADGAAVAAAISPRASSVAS